MNAAPIPFWRNTRVLNVLSQLLVLGVVVAIAVFLYSNLVTNFRQRGLQFGFDFLWSASTFEIGDKPIDYTPGTSSYGMAIVVGLLNSLKVMVVSIIVATLVGVIAGIARLSDNWLVQKIATVYVELFRNTPLLLQLFFWYTVLFLQFPALPNYWRFAGAILTINGSYLPFPVNSFRTGLACGLFGLSLVLAILFWRRSVARGEASGKVVGAIALFSILLLCFGLEWQLPTVTASDVTGGVRLVPEFGALVIGLSLYTASFIAEVVRSGIQSVPRGQWEAARSLGLKPSLMMQLIILPQALRVAVPPLTTEYANLAKNSSLGVAIAYADLYGIANIVLTQSGRSVELVLIIMVMYLLINLAISLVMNQINRWVQVKER
jgi:general L-amino acid transport system permease protein